MTLLLIIIILFFIPLTGLAGWWCTVLEMKEPGLLQRLLFRPGNVRKPQPGVRVWSKVAFYALLMWAFGLAAG